MALLHGGARDYALDGRADLPREPILSVVASSDAAFIAVLTPTKLYIWSDKPRVIVTTLERTKEQIASTGTFTAVQWRPNAMQLAVLTSEGAVVLLEMVPRDPAVVLSVHIQGDRVGMLGVGESHGVVHYALKYLAKPIPLGSVLCYAATHDDILIGAKGLLITVAWDGAMDPHAHVAIPSFSFVGDTAVDFVDMVYEAMSGTLAAIASNGRAFLLWRRHHDARLAWEGTSLDMSAGDKASAVALHGMMGLAAVGLTCGDVLLVHYDPADGGSAGAPQRLPLRRLFSDNIDAFAQSALAGVQSLAWSEDGGTIAVLHVGGLVAFWSAFGCFLCAQTTDAEALNARSLEALPPRGPRLAWDQQGTELLVGGNPFLFDGGFGGYPCVRPFWSLSHVSSNLRSGAMLGETYLMLSMLDATDADLLLPDVQLWRYIQLPTAYIAENWPIQHAALSDDGRHVVIAGERGLAMCNLLAAKWKLFGNLQHEKEFACCGGVAWFRDVAVLGCRDMRTGAFQLRAFSRKQNLDVANALLVYELPRAPLYVAVAGRHLLVYLENNVVHEYIVEASCNAENDVTSIKLKAVAATSVAALVSHPLHLRSIGLIHSVVPKNAATEAEFSDDDHYLVLTNRVLAVHPRQASSKEPPTTIADHVQFAWTAPWSQELGPLRGSLWIVGQTEISVSMWRFSDDADGQDEHMLSFAHSPQPISIPLQFAPLAICIEHGVVMGGDVQGSGRQYNVGGTMVQTYGAGTKMLLFLQHLFRQMLLQNRFRATTQLGNHYKRLPFFGFALELLLHDSLEAELGAQQENKQTNLSLQQFPHAVSFVEQFPHYLDVVVKCARKTEVERWPYFFRFCGDPEDLFDACLQTGRLKTATAYLIILQNLVPDGVSGKEAVKLLETTLNSGDFKTVAELLRFLRSIAGSADLFEGKESNGRRGSRSSNGSAGGTMSDDTSNTDFYLDLILSRFVRKLVSDFAMRTLSQFLRAVRFPLADWLARHRHKLAPLTDLTKALSSLHLQFAWPMPTERALPEELAAFVADELPMERTPRGEELALLLEAFSKATCWEYVVAIGCLLGEDRQVAAAIITAGEDVAKRFDEAMSDYERFGYGPFAEKVRQHIAVITTGP